MSSRKKKTSTSVQKKKKTDFECEIDTLVPSFKETIEKCVKNSKIVIRIGKRKIDDTWVEFDMKIFKTGQTYNAFIPIPKGYPATQFKKDSGENGRIVDITLSIHETPKSTSQDAWDKYYRECNSKEKTKGKQYIILHAFYVKTNLVDPDILTESEKRVFKGFGKNSLCFLLGMTRIYFREIFKESETLILLEASGGRINSRQDRERISALIKSGQTEDDADWIVRLEKNRILVNYYSKSYGFKRFSDEEDNADLMYARASTVLDNCGLKYKRDKVH